MSETLYAAYRDPKAAEIASASLLDMGIRADDMSLILRDESELRAPKYAPTEDEIRFNAQQTYSGTDHTMSQYDPLGNDVRVGGVYIQGGDVSQSDLNPAQDDYPRGPVTDAATFSSAPPDAKRDYNAGLEGDDYNRHYRADVDQENREEAKSAEERLEEVAPERRVAGSNTEMAARDQDRERTAVAADIEHRQIDDTTDTVKKSAGLGLGIGALAAVAALTVPGFGVILGGGALAAALAGIATSSGSGAVAGGLVSYLKDQGVDPDDIPRYRDVYEAGGAILAVQLSGNIDRARAEETLRRGGAELVNRYGYMA